MSKIALPSRIHAHDTKSGVMLSNYSDKAITNIETGHLELLQDIIILMRLRCLTYLGLTNGAMQRCSKTRSRPLSVKHVEGRSEE